MQFITKSKVYLHFQGCMRDSFDLTMSSKHLLFLGLGFFLIVASLRKSSIHSFYWLEVLIKSQMC